MSLIQRAGSGMSFVCLYQFIILCTTPKTPKRSIRAKRSKKTQASWLQNDSCQYINARPRDARYALNLLVSWHHLVPWLYDQ